MIGVELAKCIVDRRRTEFVATRPRSRDTQAGQLVENDSEALIGRRVRAESTPPVNHSIGLTRLGLITRTSDAASIRWRTPTGI